MKVQAEIQTAVQAEIQAAVQAVIQKVIQALFSRQKAAKQEDAKQNLHTEEGDQL